MKTDYLERASYPTDLTDEQWVQIEPLFVGIREYTLGGGKFNSSKTRFSPNGSPEKFRLVKQENFSVPHITHSLNGYMLKKFSLI